MDKRESLKEIERRAYRSTFEDGLYDLLWGGMFLIFAWIPVLEAIGISRFFGYACLLALFLIPWLGKRYITIPRLGAVEFGPKRKARTRVTTLVGIAVLVLALPLVIMMFVQGVPDGQIWMTVAVVGALVFAIGVIVVGFSRMYIYAAVLLFSVAASEFLLKFMSQPYVNLVTFGIPGALITVYGFYLLAAFVRRYHRPGPEATHVG